jgi:hypothetical protein
MKYSKGTGTPLVNDTKQLLVGLALFIAGFPIGIVSLAWGAFISLLGISLILLSIEREATLRAGRYAFWSALIALGIAVGLLLCR